MAIFSRTNEGAAGEPAGQHEAVAVESAAPQQREEITPEAITAPPTPAQTVAGPAQSAAGNLPAALEPELRRIIDTAVARVAAIELDAIREARELTQRSEREARDALRFALDRAFNLINSLELLASTVNGMAEALKVELDDAITALRNVPEPESELARELAGGEQPPEPVAQEPVVEQPAPEPAAEQPAVAPEPAVEQPAVEQPAVEQPAVEQPAAEQPAVERPVVAAPEPPREEPAAVEPEPEQPAEPRIKLTPIVRPAEVPETAEQTAGPAPVAAEPERELVTVGAPAKPAKHKSQPPHSRKGRVRRFFTR